MNKFHSICRLNIIFWSLLIILNIGWSLLIILNNGWDLFSTVFGSTFSICYGSIYFICYSSIYFICGVVLIIFWTRMLDISKGVGTRMKKAAILGIVAATMNSLANVIPLFAYNYFLIWCASFHTLEVIALLMIVKYFKSFQKVACIILLSCIILLLCCFLIVFLLFTFYTTADELLYFQLESMKVLLTICNYSYFISIVLFFVSLLNLKSHGKQQ